MFNVIRKQLLRLYPATNIRMAILQELGPSALNGINDNVTEEQLIDEVASITPLSSQLLLEAVAKRLHLPALYSISLPTNNLLSLTGISTNAFSQLDVIPQPDGDSYCIVCANPNNVDITSYREIGIEVYLSTAKKIQSVWKRFDQIKALHETITDKQLFSSLKDLAKHATAFGATDAFIGAEADDRYIFNGAQDQYHGSLHPSIYRRLISEHSGDKSICWSLPSDCNPKLATSVFPAGTRQVVYVYWTEQQEPEKSHLNSLSLLDELVPPIQVNEILLIEDDPDFSAMVNNLLVDRGFKVTHVRDGQAALDLVREAGYRPRLILSDIHMPKMNGTCFLAELRELGLEIPVLMLTSDDDEMLEADHLELGANGFLRKTERPEILVAWCKRFITPLPTNYKTQQVA